MKKFRQLSGRGKVGFVAAIILLVLALAGLGFVWWASQAASPMPEALNALESTEQVTVTQGDWFVFTPTAATPTTGFIFYPGGRVDARAYAPSAQAIAADGYLVVIPPMPLNLAIFGQGKASAIMAANPDIERWYIGGHSLGGAMAASFIAAQPDQVAGLVLWAAYATEGASLAAMPNVQVTSIYGTNDGLATPAKIEAAMPYLPSSTTYVPIEGGNHAQFGWYGPQSSDNAATISREEQQAQVIAATLIALGAE